MKTMTVFIVGRISQALEDRITNQLNTYETEKFDRLVVLMNSEGGDVGPGFRIYEMLKQIGNTTAYNVGHVASIAVSIFLGCENRYSLTGSTFMVHPTALTVSGIMQLNNYKLKSDIDMGSWTLNVQELQKAIDEIKPTDDRTLDIYAKETGIKRTVFEELFKQNVKRDSEKKMTSEQAIKLKIISDEVEFLQTET